MERKFILQGMECHASIGIYDNERKNPQKVIIDAELVLTPETEPLTDEVDTTLNYDLIRKTIIKVVSARHYDLQETMARFIFDALKTLDDVQLVRIKTSKPDAYNDCQTISYQLGDF